MGTGRSGTVTINLGIRQKGSTIGQFPSDRLKYSNQMT